VARTPRSWRWASYITLGAALLTSLAFGFRTWHVPPTAPLTRSPAGRTLRWVPPEIVIQPFAPRDKVAAADLIQALESGARTWNQALAGCGVPALKALPLAPGKPNLGRDGRSHLVVRSNRWCPDDMGDQSNCYPPESAAQTHLHPEDVAGRAFAEVREADIEINAKDFTWSLHGKEPGTRALDVIVLHELGHVLGLTHACESPSANGRAPDAPPCTERFASELMNPAPVAPGARPTLTPTSAEVRAVCSIYADAR
jgi:hypothetical protein